MPKLPISLQLYTLREQTAKDMAGTLKQVAKMGYGYIELAGLGNLTSASELKKVLDDTGLKLSASHISLEAAQKEQELGRILDDNHTLANRNLIFAWVPPELRKNAADWRASGQAVSKVAARAQTAGFEVAYHNHDFEFAKFDGRYALDIFFEACGSQSVKFELDVFWAAYADEDPIAWIEKETGRLTMLHLKDMTAPPQRHFAPVGTGTLDFPKIVAAAVRAGVRFGCVEQDNTYGADPLKEVETSLRNLKKMGLVQE